jgi:NAD(P)H-hydrate repair Nnr-like enzyme with NAD(P)H-hydrate dehydratase domain
MATGAFMEQWKVWTAEDARKFVSVPSENDDKYSRGVLGVIAGSEQYPGAAVMVCEVLTHRPEVVTEDGQVQAWAIGSGLDAGQIGLQRRLMIQTKLGQALPAVLDAGGLSFLHEVSGPILITPHYRELATLLGSSGVNVTQAEVREDPKKWARFAADSLHVTVLLKGNRSYVVSKTCEIALPSASPWLATAGTGDVLAGILGALLAAHSRQICEQPEFAPAIAATGSLIHALAAESASNGGPITAMGVAHAIPKVISDLLHKGL